jgi:hypothetical protein
VRERVAVVTEAGRRTPASPGVPEPQAVGAGNPTSADDPSGRVEFAGLAARRTGTGQGAPTATGGADCRGRPAA